jgi:hypothetical protein
MVVSGSVQKPVLPVPKLKLTCRRGIVQTCAIQYKVITQCPEVKDEQPSTTHQSSAVQSISLLTLTLNVLGIEANWTYNRQSYRSVYRAKYLVMDFFKKAQASLGGQGGEGGDLLKQAQGFVSSHGSSGAPAATSANPTEGAAPVAPPTTEEAPKPGQHGYSEVFGSAQTLYQGIQENLQGKGNDVDNQQLAKAASDVLKAADNAGFAKGTQYESYFDKAEGYLENYGQPKAGAAGSHVAAAAPGAAPTSAPEAPHAAPAAAPAAAPVETEAPAADLPQ